MINNTRSTFLKVAIVFAIGVFGMACSSGPSEYDGVVDTGTDGVVDADVDFVTDIDIDSSQICSEDRECPSGQYCSDIGRCIPEGSCMVDTDCGEGLHCGSGSHTCLGPDECVVDGDCGPDLICDDTGTCIDCGGAEFGLTQIAPNMLILLDRSGSMEGRIGDQTRWDVAKEAVQIVTTRFDAEIRFGLATFSACLPGGCSPGSIVVPIADNNATAINDFLAPLLGNGSHDGSPPNYLCDSGDPETTTGASLEALVGEMQIQDPERLNTVLLITDGEESRDCDQPTGAEGARMLFEQTISVRTYAVGFSEDADMAQVHAVAEAGGTGEGYYADDTTTLIAALETIASDIVRCDFLMGEIPLDEDLIYVYFNDDPVGIENDPVDGWTYDAATNSIHFHGESCRLIQDGTVTDIDVVYGCPGPVPL